MTKIKKYKVRCGAFLLILLVIFFLGCDLGNPTDPVSRAEQLGDYPRDPDETIVIQNRSGINTVIVYIDGIPKGTVNSGKDLVLKGDYDGTRRFSADSGTRTWGPKYYDVPQGGTFTWTLN